MMRFQYIIQRTFLYKHTSKNNIQYSKPKYVSSWSDRHKIIGSEMRKDKYKYS